MLTRVLIVDDSAEWCGAVRHLLERSGLFSVEGEYADGLSAVAGAGSTGASVALVDINLQDDSGWRVAQELAERHPGLSAVMMSAEDIPDQELPAAILGVLRKYEDPTGLALKLQAMLSGVPLEGARELPGAPYTQVERRVRVEEWQESLHDGPLQLVLAAQALAADKASSTGDGAWLEQARMLALAAAQMRFVISRRQIARPPRLEELAQVVGGLPVKSHVDESVWDRLSPSSQNAMMAFAHESAANSARHSRGSQVSVSLSGEGDTAVLVVSDNGHCSEIPQESPGHLGMRLQRQRAEEAGGRAQWRISSDGALECELVLTFSP